MEDVFHLSKLQISPMPYGKFVTGWDISKIGLTRDERTEIIILRIKEIDVHNNIKLYSAFEFK